MTYSTITETISAIATPQGNGGIGIIRISGPCAFEVVNKIFSVKILVPGQIYVGSICENGIKIDEAVVLPFKSPKSYTGEDLIEIQCHGGFVITNKVLDLTLKNGARLAQKGEFTKRAFLNGKIDLSQAEAVLDIINANTEKFAVAGASNLFGKLTAETDSVRDAVKNLYSKIIAAVDFPEDIQEPEYEFIIEETKSVIQKINRILSFAKSSNIFRQGIKIVLAGKPNTGKSSLFNALLNLERAIVTDIAGTTRDVIKETADIDGICATVIDTAGIRDTDNINRVEAIGIDFSKKSILEADTVLFLYDLSQGFTREDEEIFNLIKDKNYIKVGTKCDLTDFKDPDSVCISLKTGENLDLLKSEIKKSVASADLTEIEFITNKRQQKCLEEAKDALIRALEAAENNEIQDLISIDIKSALLHISELSGEVVTDEVLDGIFENFCIGK